jgi:hypothetical protein
LQYETAIIGLPVSILVLIIFLIVSLFMWRQFVFRETQKEQFTLLRLTNIPLDTIFYCLIFVVIYRARHWLTWIVGLFPFFLWFICEGILLLSFIPRSSSWCLVSPLGHTYCYGDKFLNQMLFFEYFWFMGITISILGIGIALTMKNKNDLSHTIALILFTLSLILALVLLVAPEGFILIDSSDQWLRVEQAPFIGILIAALPCIAAFGIQHRLRHWALD